MRPTVSPTPVRSTSLRRFLKKVVNKIKVKKYKKDHCRPQEIPQHEPESEPCAAPTVPAFDFSPRTAEFCPPPPPRPTTKSVPQVQRHLGEFAPSSIAEYEDTFVDEPTCKKARLGSAAAASLPLDIQIQGQKRKRGQLPTNPRIATNLSCGFVARHVADLPSSCRHARPSGLTFYERFPGKAQLATVFEEEEVEPSSPLEHATGSGSSTPSLELLLASEHENLQEVDCPWADREDAETYLPSYDDDDDDDDDGDSEIARCDAEVVRITAAIFNADGTKTAAFLAIPRPDGYLGDDKNDFTPSPYRLRHENTNNKPTPIKPPSKDLDVSGLMFLPATEAPKMANNIWAPYE